jgi:hypothetical protein
MRPDFKLKDNLYLETDGLYWHSDAVIEDKWSHFKRREEFNAQGYRLLQLREDEIKQKKSIVKSILLNAMGHTTNRLAARKCTILKVDNAIAKSFFDINHLMGHSVGKTVVLEHNQNIVAGMSYQIRQNELHIVRFCNALQTTVAGGFSRLLSHAIKTESFRGAVVNFVDLRYGDGSAAKKLGFTLESVSLGWKWTDFKYTYNRLKCRANMDERKLTEAQHATELDWVKIYDAGQAKFVKTVDPGD